MNPRILIIEDDRDLGNLLRQYLALHGFEPELASDGLAARRAMSAGSYDLLVIDVMMPNEDGFTFAAGLRESRPDLPFLFVTAKNMQADRLHGLKLGADDYIAKPFDADELVLRLQNILRRSHRAGVNQGPELRIGAYAFEPDKLVLRSGTSEQLLTEKEARLLLYLYHHQHELIKRKDILEHLWPEADFFFGRSMDVFITRLRKLLAQDPSIRIESIRGVGFRFYC